MIHNKKYETKVLEEYFRSENFKYFKENISLKKTYLVDPSILSKNRYKSLQQFNPVKSIVETTDIKGGRRKTLKRLHKEVHRRVY